MITINAKYFERNLLLQVSQAAAKLDVEMHIAKYGQEYFDKVLGVSLYEAFIAGISAAGDFDILDFDPADFETGVDDRWRWLLYGHIYTVGGRKYRWAGFINDLKDSPIAAYVYYWYRRNRITSTQAAGETSSTVENGTVVSPEQKMADAWNSMVDQNCDLQTILRGALDDDGATLYPELVLCEQDGINMFYRINTFNI